MSAQVTHVLIWSLGYILVGGSFVLDEGGKKSIAMFWALFSVLLLSGNAMVFSFPIHKYRRMRLQDIVGNSPQRSSTSKTS